MILESPAYRPQNEPTEAAQPPALKNLLSPLSESDFQWVIDSAGNDYEALYASCQGIELAGPKGLLATDTLGRLYTFGF